PDLDGWQSLCFACSGSLNPGIVRERDNKKVPAAAKIGLKELVAELAPQQGFDVAGVVRVEAFPELQRFEGWIAEDRAGEMKYLAGTNEQGELKRAAVENAVPWAKSAIVCGAIYNSAAPFSVDPADEHAGWISRYAWFQNYDSERSTDYHDVLLARLRALEGEMTARWPEPGRTWSY